MPCATEVFLGRLGGEELLHRIMKMHQEEDVDVLQIVSQILSAVVPKMKNGLLSFQTFSFLLYWCLPPSSFVFFCVRGAVRILCRRPCASFPLSLSLFFSLSLSLFRSSPPTTHSVPRDARTRRRILLQGAAPASACWVQCAVTGIVCACTEADFLVGTAPSALSLSLSLSCAIVGRA